MKQLKEFENELFDTTMHLLGFYKRKSFVETQHTWKVRYFFFRNDTDRKHWHPHLTVEVRYWKGGAKPTKYNVRRPKSYGLYVNQANKLVTIDPSEALDSINEELR